MRWAQRHPVLIACAATALVHLTQLSRDLSPDEGGYAMVARFWGSGGRFLYGPQFVDRPPGLLLVFAGADRLGPLGVRLTAVLVAVALVAAVAWATSALSRTAAGWAAWAAFAFASSVLLDAQMLNGELLAAVFVALSLGASLRAASRRGGLIVFGYAALAGMTAASAVLVKQNFVDGFAFAGALMVSAGTTAAGRAALRRRALPGVGGVLAGALVPLGVAAAWATAHHGVGALVYAMYGFRRDAALVMAGWSWAAPDLRLGELLVVGGLSGLLVLVVWLLLEQRCRLRRREAVAWALLTTGVVEVAGVVGGENFWRHYLLALVPTVAVAAGLAARRGEVGARWTRRLIVVAAASTAVLTPMFGVVSAASPDAAYTTGRWVSAAAHVHDSVVVPFSHANVVDFTGLRPVYPYSWSLPVRTLDPRLHRLVALLDGPGRPTWVVRWDAPDSWGLDPGGRLDTSLRAHYREVALVCGHPVWLADGVTRVIPPTPSTQTCG